MPKRREGLKRWSAFGPIRLLNLKLRNRYVGLPHWRVLKGDGESAWREARGAAAGPKVLLATSVGAHMAANTLDSLLAVALTLRGARVHGLLCYRAFPAVVRISIAGHDERVPARPMYRWIEGNYVHSGKPDR